MRPTLNITEAPYNADSKGERDCTRAICQALDDITEATRLAFRQTLAEMERLPAEGYFTHPTSFENRRVDGVAHCVTCAHLPYLPVLYFPEGTYLVSDTLSYTHKDLHDTYGSAMNQQIRIRGEGVDKTVIRLHDCAEGFSAGSGKPVISYMPDKQSSNIATSNYCEDLSINCGTGNPGAVGIDFFANNSGAVRNVRVLSEDGRGLAGVRLGHSNYSGILLKHIEVRGFDHGLHVDSETGTMFAHAEDIHLSGQRVSGITVGAISLSLRKIVTADLPVAVTCIHPVGLTVLVDSDLSGTGPVAIDRQAGFLYASQVNTQGFDKCVRRGSPACERNDEGQLGRLHEWVYPRAFGEEPEHGGMDRLAIEETPVWVPRRTTTGVRTFGAIGNEANDDSRAIQAAFNGGATDICFEPGRYLLNSPVVIPPHIEHIDFSFCDLVAGVDLARSDQEGFLITGEATDSVLFVERLLAWERWCGSHCTFTHAGTRTVCFKDIQTQALAFYRNTVPGGKVFIDNVAFTTGKHSTDAGDPGTCCGASFKSQKVWARQFNPERGHPMVLNDGGDLVILGYKSEGRGIVVHTMNGGRTEVLGGVINIGNTGETAFLVDDAQVRISTASQGWRLLAYHKLAIKERHGTRTTVFPSADMPSRGFDPSRGPQYVIPLFRSTNAPN